MGHLLQPEQKRKAINKIKAKISSYNLDSNGNPVSQFSVHCPHFTKLYIKTLISQMCNKDFTHKLKS